jgi:hypothetical protein
MNKVALYGLGGAAGVILFMSVVKRRKVTHPQIGTSQKVLPGPKVYRGVKTDRPTAIAARFGITFDQLFAANGRKAIMVDGRPVILPPGVADLGARPQAMGTVQ